MGSYLQTTDAHFERAVADLVGHQVGHKGREMAENGEPSNDKNPEKRNVFLGSAGGFVSKNYPVGTRRPLKNTGKTARFLKAVQNPVQWQSKAVHLGQTSGL